MKRIILAMMAGLVLSTTLPTMAQHHRRTPTTSVTIKATHNNGKLADTTAIVAFSDTTDADEDADSITKAWANSSNASFDLDDIDSFMKTALVPISVVFIVCFLCPVVIIGLIVYFMVKSRNQKLKLMELAIKSGQPIPEELLKNETSTDKGLYAKGIKNISIGAGLAVLFVFLGCKELSGIGFFLAIYGAGQAYLGFNAKKKKEETAQDFVPTEEETATPENAKADDNDMTSEE